MHKKNFIIIVKCSKYKFRNETTFIGLKTCRILINRFMKDKKNNSFFFWNDKGWKTDIDTAGKYIFCVRIFLEIRIVISACGQFTIVLWSFGNWSFWFKNKQVNIYILCVVQCGGLWIPNQARSTFKL